MAEDDTQTGIMNYAFNDQPLKFKSAFNDAMQSKLKDIFSDKYSEVANKVFNQHNVVFDDSLGLEMTDDDSGEDVSVDDVDVEMQADDEDITVEDDTDVDDSEDLEEPEEQELEQENDEDVQTDNS